MLTVTTAATDLTLLSVTERRAAVGVSDGSEDARLSILEARVVACITAACRVEANGTYPPTLRLETLTDTYRLKSSQDVLILSRRPIPSITSVTENDTLLDGALDYELEQSAGLLRRLSGDSFTYWPAGKIVVVHPGGWEMVPDDLKLAAVKFMQAEWQQGDRDPMLKRKKTEGVSEYEWWVDPTKDSIVPAEVMDILQRGGYVNTWIG